MASSFEISSHAGSLPDLLISEADFEVVQSLALSALRRAPDPYVAQTLLQEVERAEIVSGPLPRRAVGIGSEVTFRDGIAGKGQSLRLVLPGDADISQRKVSILTPIGAALIGLSVGQEIDWLTRDGEVRHLIIMDIKT